MMIGTILLGKSSGGNGFTCAQCRHRTCLASGRPCARVEALLPRCKNRRPAPRALPETDALIRGINCRLPSEA
jgi:hypothetical protein